MSGMPGLMYGLSARIGDPGLRVVATLVGKEEASVTRGTTLISCSGAKARADSVCTLALPVNLALPGYVVRVLLLQMT